MRMNTYIDGSTGIAYSGIYHYYNNNTIDPENIEGS